MREMEHWCSQGAADVLAGRGLLVDEAGRRNLAKAIAAAIQRASLKLAQYAKGEFDGEPVTRDRAALCPDIRHENPHPGPPIRFGDLLDGWAKEAQPVPKTIYEWRSALRRFAGFLGHDDARRVTATDVVAWKKSLIDAGLQPKTIRDAKLASVRAVFRWGVDNHHLPDNPAERVSTDVKVKPGNGDREYSDVQAAIVLKAALKAEDPVRRWVPWLCAYSGARLSEICQLRAEDVQQVEGYWCLRITAEAGSVKNAHSERTIPLHPAVLEVGFRDFVDRIKSGPLFPALRPDTFGKRGGTATKLLGPWIRSLGIAGRIQPSHGWRHRFLALCRQYEVAEKIADRLTGHTPKTVGARYGTYKIAALHRELMKIPALDLT
jgi:integrase